MKFFAGTVKMGADRAERQMEDPRNLDVRTLFLMVEDERGALDAAEGEEFFVQGELEFVGGELLVGRGRGVGEAILPELGGFSGGCDGSRKGDEGAIDTTAALPLVLGDVDGDAVEIGGEEGFAAKGGQRAEEAEKDLLGEVFEVLAGAGEAQESPEDSGLMLLDKGFELGVRVQAGSDCHRRAEFHVSE